MRVVIFDILIGFGAGIFLAGVYIYGLRKLLNRIYNRGVKDGSKEESSKHFGGYR